MSSVYILILAQILFGIEVSCTWLNEEKYIETAVAIGYTFSMSIVFFLFRKTDQTIRAIVVLSIVLKAFFRVFLPLILSEILGSTYGSINRFGDLFNLVFSIILAQFSATWFSFGALILSEITCALYTHFTIASDDDWEDIIYLAFYCLILIIFAVHSISLKSKLRKAFQDQLAAHNEIKSLKSFLDQSVFSSIAIFHLKPENRQGAPISELLSLKGKETSVEMAFSNNQIQEWAQKRTEKEKLAKADNLGNETKIERSKTPSQREIIENIGEYFEDLETNVLLSEHITRLGVEMNLIRNVCPNSSEGRKQGVKSMICKEKGKDIEKGQGLFKILLSQIIFNKKNSIILQLEDISYLKVLEEERKVSEVREKTIQ